ncbi:hypothetical protein ONZ45_g10829 [Pleurotus djamor]|nr:hypothetical protein ONZ45_g10829 [Pleurotus djamor]
MSTTTSGTQSPPLEATGEHKPMGYTSVNGNNRDSIETVPDKEQRKQYFTEDAPSESREMSKSAKLGQSLSDELDNIH